MLIRVFNLQNQNSYYIVVRCHLNECRFYINVPKIYLYICRPKIGKCRYPAKHIHAENNISKAQWDNSYLTFWFAGNCLAPTINRHWGFNATLKSIQSIHMGDKYDLQCPKLKINHRMYSIVSFLTLWFKFPTLSRVCVIMMWNYGNVVCVE